MLSTLNALVPHAPATLIEAIRKTHQRAHVSRGDTLVVPLRSDRQTSIKLFPEEWNDDRPGTSLSGRIRFRPNFQSGVVQEVYKIPTELQDVKYELTFQAAEVHNRGSYCQIVTAFNGSKLKPFRRESANRRSEEAIHPTASVFSANRMGLLRLDIRQRQQLAIYRASVVKGKETALVTHQQVYRISDAYLAAVRVESLPKQAARWQAALDACYARLDCSRMRCDGHYHHG